MTQGIIEANCTKAGFDLTDMPVEQWLNLLEEMNIADGVITEGEKQWSDRVPRYWTWKGNEGFIVTKCNPVTGEHLDDLVLDPRPESLSYVGIEGTKAFVDQVFRYIRDNASFSKGKCYGERGFL